MQTLKKTHYFVYSTDNNYGLPKDTDLSLLKFTDVDNHEVVALRSFCPEGRWWTEWVTVQAANGVPELTRIMPTERNGGVYFRDEEGFVTVKKYGDFQVRLIEGDYITSLHHTDMVP